MKFIQKPIQKPMEKEEKQLTEEVIGDKKLFITTTLDTFSTLHKEVQRRNLRVVDLCEEIGVSPSAYYRYLNNYKSQKIVQPSYLTLSRFAEALGYDIKLVEKNEIK